VVLVGGMTRMPRVQQIVKEIFGKEGHKGVNPDEVVAVGAAIQGAQLLLGSKSDVLLLDVTPLSLGIETLGGVMTRLVERNTTIPAERKQVFTTAGDNQTAVTVRVFQGDREMAADNRLLGRFNLEGIPPAPRGVPQIEVKFDIDANGILNVSAKDLGTGSEQIVRIEQSSGLSEIEIAKLRKDFELLADADRKKIALIEARNEAESRAYRLEKRLIAQGDKLKDSDKHSLEAAIAKVRETTKGDDSGRIKSAISELEAASHAMSEALFTATAGASAGAGAGPSPGASA
jgi:molecular chaperone DnaK